MGPKFLKFTDSDAVNHNFTYLDMQEPIVKEQGNQTLFKIFGGLKFEEIIGLNITMTIDWEQVFNAKQYISVHPCCKIHPWNGYPNDNQTWIAAGNSYVLKLAQPEGSMCIVEQYVPVALNQYSP